MNLDTMLYIRMNNSHSRFDLVARSVTGLILGYIRWTQLLPMILAWTFLLLVLGVMFLSVFMNEVPSLMEASLNWLVQAGWLQKPAHEALLAEPQALRFDHHDIREFVIRAWTGLAGVLLVLSMIIRKLFGPTEPLPYWVKIAIVMLLAVIVFLGALGIYQHKPELFQGAFGSWLAIFVGGPMVVLLISVCSLTVSHMLYRLECWVDPLGVTPAPVETAITPALHGGSAGAVV
jgi:hypothetical protein